MAPEMASLQETIKRKFGVTAHKGSEGQALPKCQSPTFYNLSLVINLPCNLSLFVSLSPLLGSEEAEMGGKQNCLGTNSACLLKTILI